MAGSSKDYTQYHKDIDDIAQTLARRFASQNKSNVLSYDDFYMEAWVAALERLGHYDPQKSSIRSFLTLVMRYHLIHFANANLSHLRVSSATIKRAVEIYKLRADGATTAQIAKKIGGDEKFVLQHEGLLNIWSFNQLTEDQYRKFSTSSEHGFTVWEIYDYLYDQDQNVELLEKYMNRSTLKELAAEYKTTPETIRQELLHIMRMIEEYLKDD